MPQLNIELDLTNCDGNAFAIIGKARRAMMNASDPDTYDEHWRVFHLEAVGGDYDNLVQTCQKWFNVV